MSAGLDTILVLAARRGPLDPLARHAGVSHKCLIPIAGMAMIERVVGILRRLEPSPTIVIAIDKAEILDALPEVRAVLTAKRLRVMAAADSPSRTVLAAMQQGLVRPPFLVTTADHPLLTASMIGYFWQHVPAGVDAAAAVASASIIRKAWPKAQRTYLRFNDGSYSGCNLFAMMTSRAEAAVAFWQRAEARRKHPAAMMRLLGPVAVLRFLLGAMSLTAAVEHLGRRTGTRLAAIDLPFAEAAVDVDKAEDLALARQILEQRNSEAVAPPAAAMGGSG